MRERLGHLRVGLVASGGLLLVAVAIGYLARGGTGAAGAAAGVAIVVASYSVSSVAVAWADSVDPQLVLKVGITVYVTKITIIGVVMSVVAGSGWAGLEPMGVAVVAAVVVWCGVQIWWVRHQQRPRWTDR